MLLLQNCHNKTHPNVLHAGLADKLVGQSLEENELPSETGLEHSLQAKSNQDSLHARTMVESSKDQIILWPCQRRNDTCKGGCIFVDASSSFVHSGFQNHLNSHETLQAVQNFETLAQDDETIVQRCQSDDSAASTSKAFKDCRGSQ